MKNRAFTELSSMAGSSSGVMSDPPNLRMVRPNLPRLEQTLACLGKNTKTFEPAQVSIIRFGLCDCGDAVKLGVDLIELVDLPGAHGINTV